MPLSMTLNTSNETPLVTPCFDGKELHIDSELVSAGLSAISVKGREAGDPPQDIGIRHRNSFWSVHRPELSKLNWTSDHSAQNIENYLKVQAGNHHSNKEFDKFDIPPADLMTVIHTNLDQRQDIDEKYLVIPKPQTTQFSDDDLESHTTLHKSRAEFCVTIGHIGKQLINDPTSEASGSKNGGGKSLFYENDVGKNMGLRTSGEKIETVFSPEEIAPIIKDDDNLGAILGSYYKEKLENFDNQQMDKELVNISQEMLIALMDDTDKDRQQTH